MKVPVNILNEGGSLPGAGAIHISEIEPTLRPLEKFLGIDLVNNMLGSAGKKQFSGDIDVAVDLTPEQIPEFIEKLEKYPGISDIKKSSVIMTKVKIENFDPNIEKDSKYKGVYRNLLLSSITMFLDRKESKEKIPDGRPKEIERFLWSPTDGLVRIIRKPTPNKKGDGYTKANSNEIIDGPYKTPEEIAKILKLDSPDDLYSYETLKKAIVKNYDPELVRKILADFKDNPVVQQFGVPTDLVSESFSSEWFRVMMDMIK